MRLGRTSAIAHCTVCEKEWQFLNTAFQEAQEHTRRTGHITRGEAVEVHEWARTAKGRSLSTNTNKEPK